MAVVVDLDLALVGFINREFQDIDYVVKENDVNDPNNFRYDAMTICVANVEGFARSMMDWALGRVVINFTREDVINYLEYHSEIFKLISKSSNGNYNYDIYGFVMPDDITKREYFIKLIEKLCLEMKNYDGHVLRVIGLLGNNLSSEENELAEKKALTLKNN